ncbi:hypothetical protein U1Q18_042412 [Sarracenia purpurea var. burkii]
MNGRKRRSWHIAQRREETGGEKASSKRQPEKKEGNPSDQQSESVSSPAQVLKEGGVEEDFGQSLRRLRRLFRNFFSLIPAEIKATVSEIFLNEKSRRNQI